jgi:hypothetical protein
LKVRENAVKIQLFTTKTTYQMVHKENKEKKRKRNFKNKKTSVKVREYTKYY